MKIVVKAKTKAKKEGVERVNQPTLNFIENKSNKDEIVMYKVSVKEAPVAGKANEAIIKLLAEYFSVTRDNVYLISGQKSKQKIFEIIV